MMKSLKTTLATAASGLVLMLAAPAMAETPAVPAGPALWKVADADTTIYLFGTVHVLPDGKNWFTPTIETALDSSDMLVTEIPSGPETDARTLQLVNELGMLPEGTTLRSLMTEEQRANYEAALGGLGVPPEAFDAYEPWLATINLSILPLILQGYQIDKGVEEVLEVEADKAIERGALETIEFQMGIFDSGSLQDQLAYLDTAASDVDKVTPMLNAMVDEWIEGDADGLAAIMNESLAETPAMAETLLYNRNANWAEWIEARLEQPGTVFVAVGAGHLAGERSVQDYLAQRGITTDRVQ
ncbi:TraB/GumN family protein [Erythrobacter sp. SDW2]|uniref:TraB/GumN family protein n=1 Tax=Erythrobacter sp. SDW2 TaxID=2907154 RepID=UPI001F16F14A|nr:TraB/GumN family protein [Erythrobacter sp. SDW2]UIP05827.1 TraB/GumN family protein [Erythrobacter sp. SDW2]